MAVDVFFVDFSVVPFAGPVVVFVGGAGYVAVVVPGHEPDPVGAAGDEGFGIWDCAVLR